MLYLASNFSSLDPRDMIYGLHGILQYTDTTTLLKPDYSKSLLEVYRDSVEAAFLNCLVIRHRQREIFLDSTLEVGNKDPTTNQGCLRPEVPNGERWTMGAFEPTTNSRSFGQRLWLTVGRNSYKTRGMHIRCSWGLCKKPMVRWGSVVSIVVFSFCCFVFGFTFYIGFTMSWVYSLWL